MRLVVIGGTGSIGRRLVPALLKRGDSIALVSRRPRDARRLYEGIDRGKTGMLEVVPGDCEYPGPWQQVIDGADAVVHLAGAGVAEKRWSRKRCELIERSRVESTHQVVAAIEDAKLRPPTFVCASATGIYGDNADEIVGERFPPGKGFLADLCVRWEEEARRAEAFGVRVVRARIGIVLDEEGPALKAMLPWFRNGLGAVLGTGKQYVPWIHYRDCVAALLRAIDRRSLVGAVNVTAPEPSSQREFAKALAKAVGRPLLLWAPQAPVRLLLGGIADEAFRSQRAVPKALLADGMEFEATTIQRAMELLVEEEAARERRTSPRASRSAAQGAEGGGRDAILASLPKATTPARRPKLLVVSADAFVADGNGRVRPGVREAIRAASSCGTAVVLATERSSSAAAWLLAEPLLHPVAIVSNGAVLWNAGEGAAVHVERLEAALVAAILLAARRAAPEIAVLFEGDRWVASDGELPAGLSSITGALTLRLGPNEVPDRAVARMHFVGAPDTVGRARAAIERPFWSDRSIALFGHGATRLVVTAPTVDRAVAAQRIARQLGVSREETMALVGTLDDLGLADWCGFSVAGGEVPDPVRRLAGVALDPQADALGESVRRYLLR